MGIPDKSIDGSDWSSVNVLSGLPIGTPMAIPLISQKVLSELLMVPVGL